MENYVLLHPIDFLRLTLDNPEEYIEYSKCSDELPYVEIEGLSLGVYRSFRLLGILYIECRVKIKGEFLVKEQKPVVKPVPLSFNALLDLLKPYMTRNTNDAITEIAISASVRGPCIIGIDSYSFKNESHSTEMNYLVKRIK